jgi:stage V sporulation protein G
MQVTDVRVSINNDEKKSLKASVSVTFDGEFVVHGIKVIESKEGKTFVSMPQTKTNDGFKDICHPINTDFRNYVAGEVMKAYNAKIND